MVSRPSTGPLDPTNLYGLDRPGLSEVLAGYDVPGFHANQVYRWLYGRRRLNPDEWTDLPRSLRAGLARDVEINPGRLAQPVEAADGTVKYRVELSGGGSVEAVYMVHRNDRVTLCVSSQVGCALDCDFCLTAKMGFVRHLSPGEIVGQIALVQDDRALGDRPIHIVFMGMGEPLHNYDAVLAAVGLLTDAQGFGFSRKRITVSTSGLVPGIERLSRETVRPRLAVSLNATTDAVRSRIMPINRKYSLDRLLATCGAYARDTGDRFTFEYVLLAGVNDTPEDMRRLASIVLRLPAKLNLIPFNAVEGWLDYRPPSRQRILAVRDDLLARGVPVSIRWSKGLEARAACGQLALLTDETPHGGAARRPR